MKYTEEDYLSCEYNGYDGIEMEEYKSKVVKCRKDHECLSGEESCVKIIKAGEYALKETGYIDDRHITCYTCISCVDRWLDELRRTPQN